MAREKNKPSGFFLRLPKGRRRRFAVVRYTEDSGRRLCQTLQDERIDAVNLNFTQGSLSLERAESELRELIRTLRGGKEERSSIRAGLLDDNAKIFDRFWEEIYEGRELADRRTAELEYLRALRALGTTPLLSASKTDIAKALRLGCNRKQHRRAVTSLNSLLKFLGRAIRLDKPEEDLEEIQYLTIEEVHTLLKLEEDPACRALYATLFSTGMRIGETMPLSPSTPLSGRLFVEKQITKEGRLKKPKRGKTGEIAYLREFEGYIKEWCSVEDKPQYRRIALYRLKDLTKQLWPGKPVKQVTLQGLRHSHAIHLLSLGVPMDFVARNLRNRIEVCQKHYAGFSHSTSTISALQALLASSISK